MFLSETFNPKAKRIFRFVSTLQGLPCSILVRVSDDIFDFLASSALLIMKDSLISFKEFVLIKEFVFIFSPKTCFVLSSYPNRVKIRFEYFKICFNHLLIRDKRIFKRTLLRFKV
jgi:hypothetical protein